MGSRGSSRMAYHTAAQSTDRPRQPICIHPGRRNHVMVIRVVPRTMIVPPGNRVDQTSRVEASDHRCELDLRRRVELSPALVIDYPSIDRGE